MTGLSLSTAKVNRRCADTAVWAMLPLAGLLLADGYPLLMPGVWSPLKGLTVAPRPVEYLPLCPGGPRLCPMTDFRIEHDGDHQVPICHWYRRVREAL